MGVRATTAGLVMLVLLAPMVSRADVEAGSLLQEGILRYKVGKFEGSVKVLGRAVKLTRKPALLGQIHLYLGLNHSTLGRRRAAREAFRTALTHDPALVLDPRKHKKMVVDLMEQVRQGLKGTLQVTADGQGAVVWVDGKEAGKVPLSMDLPVGRHRIKVASADGRARFRGEVVVRAAQKARVAARLTPIRGRLSVVSDPSGVEVLMDGKRLGTTPLERMDVSAGGHELILRKGGFQQQRRQVAVPADQELEVTVTLELVSRAVVKPPVVKQPEPVPASRPPLVRRLLWTWVAAGGAVAAGAASLGLGLSMQADIDEFNGLSPGDTARLDELEQNIPNKATASNVMLGVAGALVVTAAVLFYVEGWVLDGTDKRAGGATLAPVVGPASGVVLTVPF